MSGARRFVSVASVALPILAVGGHGRPPAHSGPNLGICDEAKATRPGIEGLDVCVWNLGDLDGHGVVFVELLDSAGRVLLRVDADAGRDDVRLPPYHLGGKEGTLVRINPTRDFLTVIEALENGTNAYGIRATVETSGRDADPSDNSKVKELNTARHVTPGETRELRYAFRSDGALVRKVRWVMHGLTTPADWTIRGAPSESATFEWSPGEELRGRLTVLPPTRLPQGSFAEIRLAVVDASSREVLRQREWFLTRDTIPPFIANVRAILLADHSLAVQALAGDEHSGLHEQRGLVLHYSTDSGRTWTTETPVNWVGHFIEPTVFEFNSGPFMPGTMVLVRFEARDRAGNTVSVMPHDASIFVAPPNAGRLAIRERSVSQPEKSRLFDIERLQGLRDALRAQQDALRTLEQFAASTVAGLGATGAHTARRGLLTRRIEDLQKERDELSASGIDVGVFRRVERSGVTAAEYGWETLAITIP